MPFFQPPPELQNQFDDDNVLRAYLERVLPEEARTPVTESLRAMGELAGGELYRLQLADRLNEPRLTQWDPWGHRVDRIEITPLWQRAARVASEHGVVATAYEGKLGALSRVHQFALAYLFDASTDVYTCPLAMTDGAAATLTHHARHASDGIDPMNARRAADRALPRLLSRDPDTAWTSGQWMTERTGGSDVGLTETIARADDEGMYRLYGTKWFSSATTSQMALTLARPEGNPPGGRGLALFYVEIDREGRKNHILVNRLKDKLGTRKVPTAELTLEGAYATPIAGLDSGIRHISPMLNVTRTWNAIGAIAGMRRGLALAEDYARRRVQFGAPLHEKPLHRDTLDGLQAEFQAAFQLTFYAVELLGKKEHAALDARGERLLRLVTPLVKLVTGKQAVAVLSEVLECFGGAGYIEDTGLPRLLRDAQVLPIWEGTTNVLSLDALRAIGKDGGLDDLVAEVRSLASSASSAALAGPAARATAAVEHAAQWIQRAFERDPVSVEAGGRRFAMTLGRALSLALLVRQAAFDEARGRAAAHAVAARFARHGVDLVWDD